MTVDTKEKKEIKLHKNPIYSHPIYSHPIYSNNYKIIKPRKETSETDTPKTDDTPNKTKKETPKKETPKKETPKKETPNKSRKRNNSIYLDDVNQLILKKNKVFNPIIINKCKDINKGKVKLCKTTDHLDCNENPQLCKIYINDTEFSYNKDIIDKCNIDSNCWFEYWDDEVKSKYWFNLITKEATWIRPTNKIEKHIKPIYSISSLKPLLYQSGPRYEHRLSPIKEKVSILSLPTKNKLSLYKQQRTLKHRRTPSKTV